MNSWDRRSSETRMKYSAFLVYRNLGPLRTIKEAARHFYGKKFTPSRYAAFLRYSSAQDWVERAGAWDEAMLERRVVERQEEARLMNDKHAEIASLNVEVARRFVQHFLEDEDRLYSMTPKEALAFFEIGAKIERISRGEPSENISFSESAESVLDKMRDNPEAAKLHSELVGVLSRGKGAARSLSAHKGGKAAQASGKVRHYDGEPGGIGIPRGGSRPPQD